MRFALLAFVAWTLLVGCSTERHISPTLNASPRAGLELKPPILGSVFDGRAAQEPKDAASKLQADLTRAYGTAVEWVDYFTRTPPGRITVRLRIVTLGATFGSRLISTTAFANAVGSAQGNAVGPWEPVAANVSTQQSVLAGSFSGEGWWNGAAWIDFEVQDFRDSNPIQFTLPIVAEHREFNMWGYASGDKAAQEAWDRVAAQLTRIVDSVVRIVRDEQQLSSR